MTQTAMTITSAQILVSRQCSLQGQPGQLSHILPQNKKNLKINKEPSKNALRATLKAIPMP